MSMMKLKEMAKKLKTFFSIRHVFGAIKVPTKNNECVLLSLMRDEEIHLQNFYSYYKSKGIKHFYFILNRSTDASLEILKTFSDVTVFTCDLNFKYYQNYMRNFLVDTCVNNMCWYLLVDADEYFDYPYSNCVTLSDFIDYLNTNSYSAVVTQMIDMFSQGNCLQKTPDYLHTHNLCSLDFIEKKDYWSEITLKKNEICNETGNIISNDRIKRHFGGLREKYFGLSVELYLTKHSLSLKGKSKRLYDSSHGIMNSKIADISCALYHYKLVSSFAGKVHNAIQEQQYYRDSCQYKDYAKKLSGNNELRINDNSFVVLNRSGGLLELIEREFIIISDDYMKFINQSYLAVV